MRKQAFHDAKFHYLKRSDDSEGRLKRVCEFWDERYGKNRSITDVDWSPKVSSSLTLFGLRL